MCLLYLGLAGAVITLWERGESKPRLKERDTYRESHDPVDVTIVHFVTLIYGIRLNKEVTCDADLHCAF